MYLLYAERKKLVSSLKLYNISKGSDCPRGLKLQIPFWEKEGEGIQYEMTEHRTVIRLL